MTMTGGVLSLHDTAVEFKSATLTLPVLLLASNDLARIDAEVGEKVAQAPEFFRHSPLIIDLQPLHERNMAVDLAALVRLVGEHGLVPIGIRGGGEAERQAAQALNLPVLALPAGKPPREAAASAPRSESTSGPREGPEADAAAPVENKLITQPVRSGQRVYARGDLIVTATVSAGAEIMAEGNIHVYGSLRGRAMAGILGDVTSRIFCMDLQSELISIAGIYQLRDDLGREAQNKPVAVSLRDQSLVVTEL